MYTLTVTKKIDPSKRALLDAINLHAATLKQLQTFVSHETGALMDLVIHGLINLYEMHTLHPHLATLEDIETDYKKIMAFLNKRNKVKLPKYSNEKDRIIAGMRKILPELIILARISTPEERKHICELIGNLRDVNATYKPREDVGPKELKQIYLATLHLSAKKLNIHQNNSLMHVFMRAFRVIGYVFSFGALNYTESYQNSVGYKVDYLFKEGLKNPTKIIPQAIIPTGYDVNNLFKDDLKDPPKITAKLD